MKTRINNIIKKITSNKEKKVNNQQIILLLNILNINNHINYNIITVTGTNGKGSTCTILSNILTYNNISNVCHISPHLHTFNERVLYNSKSIDDKLLIEYLIKIYRCCKKLNIRIQYHTVGFLCSWLHIKYKKPEWIILEVGIGGRLDPANLFDAKIAILTSLGLDHVGILGNNIEEISLEKVQISRSNKDFIVGTKLPSSSYKYLHNINANIIIAKNRKTINPE